VTPKLIVDGKAPKDTGDLEDGLGSNSPSELQRSAGAEDSPRRRNDATPVAARVPAERTGAAAKRERSYAVHAALSRVTRLRRHCMPMDGTLDLWVLLVITALNVLAVGFGLARLYTKSAFFRWSNASDENVLWLGVVYGFSEAAPGLMFIGYLLFWRVKPAVLRLWIPLVGWTGVAAVLAIEARLISGFFFSR
jgi:hypothetical protein